MPEEIYLDPEEIKASDAMFEEMMNQKIKTILVNLVKAGSKGGEDLIKQVADEYVTGGSEFKSVMAATKKIYDEMGKHVQ